MARKAARNYFNVGFECDDGFWNSLGGANTLEAAKRFAAEIAEEYGEAPEIRKVKIVPAAPVYHRTPTISDPFLA